MENTLQEQHKELYEVRRMVENKLFQKYFAEPIKKYQDALGKSYDCKTLQELATLKGKYQGSDKFFKILKEIDNDFKNSKYDIENSDTLH